MRPDKLPFITVVMPVLNEERFVTDVLDELLGQNYPGDRFEIIVADGGSTDRTRQEVATAAQIHPQIILLDNPRRFPGSGRNVGFRNGKGDYFLVIDGHCQIGNDRLLKNVVECFEKTGADCLCRPQPFILPDRPDMQKAIGLARSSPLGHSSKSFIHSNREGWVSPVSAGCAYRREVFEQIGFVDESFDACEDVEFNYRVEKAGLKSYFCPSIAVSYHPRESLYGLWRQLVRYGEGRVRFMRKHPETMNLDMFLPALIIPGLAGGLPLGALSGIALGIYLVIAGAYFTLILFESIRISMGSAGLAAKLVAAFLVIHVSLGWSLIRALLQRDKPLQFCRNRESN